MLASAVHLNGMCFLYAFYENGDTGLRGTIDYPARTMYAQVGSRLLPPEPFCHAARLSGTALILTVFAFGLNHVIKAGGGD